MEYEYAGSWSSPYKMGPHLAEMFPLMDVSNFTHFDVTIISISTIHFMIIKISVCLFMSQFVRAHLPLFIGKS